MEHLPSPAAPAGRIDAAGAAGPGLGERIAAERDYLFAFAARQLRNREHSEDVVQSTLLAGLAAAPQYRGTASLRTWLTAILRNRIVDELRTRHREPLAADLDAHLVPGPEAALADPSAEAEARQAARRMQQRLDALPASCSRAFVMRELQGRPSREITARLSLTPGQFWQCLHKVRRELRAELGITHAHS
jgi:RNA polymerase sigma-70 factor (ECF subfamily)